VLPSSYFVNCEKCAPVGENLIRFDYTSINSTKMFQELIERAATNGVTGALAYNPVEYCIIAAGTAIAWAYTVELDLVILYTFRRRKGLYFWSLLISSWGCSLHGLGFILKFLVGTSWLVDLPFVEVGKSYQLLTHIRTPSNLNNYRMGMHGNGPSIRALLAPPPRRP